ncbi:KptA family-domain-containing protein [Pisolithus orientalis]|uniref:KptA family-domain-containing protein n=1 Tax=Pisolithus orientalis TaxID=936130 RepID=UPI002224515C|nr:KptA family-domain-containing protein [Pisolithus orientalis]KAI6010877.1 KptA family-domain-containing protein [Pisolithus orientalis]
MSAETQNKKKPTPRQRGHPRDPPEVRLSKSLSWLLRHGAKTAGLQIRSDGYARVSDVVRTANIYFNANESTRYQLANVMFKDVTFLQLQEIVNRDQKNRYHLLFEPCLTPSNNSSDDLWWIRANQGHSIKDVKLDLQPISSASEIPLAVHGTTRKAWDLIATQGLSRMKRNHVHLAQGVPGSGILSGMRNSSQVLIFIDVQKAIDAGIRFHLSKNGVVLTEGDAKGILGPQFFQRVEYADRTPVPGWEGSGPVIPREVEITQIRLAEQAADHTSVAESGRDNISAL